jgi:hypothetical protein
LGRLRQTATEHYWRARPKSLPRMRLPGRSTSFQKIAPCSRSPQDVALLTRPIMDKACCQVDFRIAAQRRRSPLDEGDVPLLFAINLEPAVEQRLEQGATRGFHGFTVAGQKAHDRKSRFPNQNDSLASTAVRKIARIIAIRLPSETVEVNVRMSLAFCIFILSQPSSRCT